MGNTLHNFRTASVRRVREDDGSTGSGDEGETEKKTDAQYAAGWLHTNTIAGFWALIKRAGTAPTTITARPPCLCTSRKRVGNTTSARIPTPSERFCGGSCCKGKPLTAYSERKSLIIQAALALHPRLLPQPQHRPESRVAPAGPAVKGGQAVLRSAIPAARLPQPAG